MKYSGNSQLLLSLSLLYLVWSAGSLSVVQAQTPAEQSVLKTGVVAENCDTIANCYVLTLENNFGVSNNFDLTLNCDGTSNVTKTVNVGSLTKKETSICPIDGTPLVSRICQIVVTGIDPNTALKTEFSNFERSCGPIDLSTYRPKVCGSSTGTNVEDDDGITACGGNPACHLANGTGDTSGFLLLIILVIMAIVILFLYMMFWRMPYDSLEANLLSKAAKSHGLYRRFEEAASSGRPIVSGSQSFVQFQQNTPTGNPLRETPGGPSSDQSAGTTLGSGRAVGSVSFSDPLVFEQSTSSNPRDHLTGIVIVPNNNINNNTGESPAALATTQSVPPAPIVRKDVHHYIHQSQGKKNQSINEEIIGNGSSGSSSGSGSNSSTSTGVKKRTKSSKKPKDQSPSQTHSAPSQSYGYDDVSMTSEVPSELESHFSDNESLFSFPPVDESSARDLEVYNQQKFENDLLLNPTAYEPNQTPKTFYLGTKRK